MTRHELLDERNKLLIVVDQERKENKVYGIKHLSLKTRKILDKIWNIDEKIMLLTI